MRTTVEKNRLSQTKSETLTATPQHSHPQTQPLKVIVALEQMKHQTRELM